MLKVIEMENIKGISQKRFEFEILPVFGIFEAVSEDFIKK